MRADAETPIWVSELVPTARQNWSAAALVAVVLVVFGALVPIATRPAAELNSFFPTLDAIVLITDLITAVLLLTQFSISRSRSLLALAFAYLFTALDRRPACPDVRRRVFSDRALGSQPADGIVAVHLLAFRVQRRASRLCGAQEARGRTDPFRRLDARGDRLVRGERGPRRRRIDVAFDRRNRPPPGDHHPAIDDQPDRALSDLGDDPAHRRGPPGARGPSALRARPVADGRRLRLHPRARL